MSRINRPRTGRCVTCRRHVEKWRASFCDACRPYANANGAAPTWTQIRQASADAMAQGRTPELVAAELGTNVSALARRLYRRREFELAHWFDAAARAARRQEAAA